MNLITTYKIYSYKNGIKLLLLSFFLINVNLALSQSCTVNAGIDMTICENETLQLDGNTPDTYSVGPTWTQIAGPPVIINDPTIPNPVITGYTGGNTYVFQLGAECFNGETPSQTVSVVVVPITQAVAGPDLASCPDTSGALVISGNLPQNPGETGRWIIFGSNDAGVSIDDDLQGTTTISLSGGTAGSTTLRWVITAQEFAPGQFCETFDELIVTNYGGVDIIDAGPNQLLSNCYIESQVTNLAGSFAGNGLDGQQGTWTFVSGPTTPTIADPNNNEAQVTDLYEGEYVFRWNVSGQCISGSDTVTIIVPAGSQAVSAANVENRYQTLCDSSITETTLVGTSGIFNNENVLWEQLQGPPATIVDPTSSTTLVTGLISPNTYKFSYTITNNESGCISNITAQIKYDTGNISISANNGASIIGACGQKSVEVPIIFSSGSQTHYSIIDGPDDSSINFPTSYVRIIGSSPTVATINDFDVAGTYTVNFRRKRTGNLLQGCDQANSSINIFISTPVSGANAGAPQQFICGQDNGFLAGSTVSPGETSIWSLVDGPDGMDNTNILDRYEQTATVTGLIPGEYTFSYTVYGGPNCDPSVSTTTVVVTPLTNFPADAGSNQYICSNAPVQLHANTLTDSQIGFWTAADPSIVFEDDTDPHTIATGFVLPSTVYTLTWTVDEAPGFPDCAPAAVDTIEITTLADESPTIADAGTDFCLPHGTTTIANLGGNTPNFDEVGTWSQISGPSAANFLSVNDPTSGVDNLVNGVYIFRWTIGFDVSVSDACPDTFDEVEVVIADTAASIDAGPDQTLCLDPVGRSFTMNAQDPTAFGGVGTWQLVSGLTGFTINDVNSPTAIFSDLLDGTYIFEWEITYGNCAASSPPNQLEIVVSTSPTPANIQGGDQVICAQNNTVITADPVLHPNSEVGVWTLVSGPNSPTIDDPQSNTINVTGLTTGSYVFRWTTVSNSPLCPNSSDDVTVDVYAPASAGSDENLCEVTSVFLQATTGTTGNWEIVSTTNPAGLASFAPSQSPSNSSSANAPVEPGYEYVYEYTTDYTGPGVACNNSDQVTISVSAGPSEEPIACDDQDICIGDTTTASLTALNASIPPGVTSQWRLISQPEGATIGFTNQNNSLTTDVTGLTVPGLYVLELNFSTNSCTDKSDIVRVEVFEAPTPAEAGPDQTLPEFASVTLAAEPTTAGQGTWSLISGPSSVNFSNENDPNSQVSGTSLGAYVFQWTVINGPCNIASDLVTVNILPFSDLELSKSVSPSNVNVGDTVTFTVSIFNDNSSVTNSDATGVSVQDILPVGYSIVPGTVSNSGAFDLGTQTITWNNLTILNGQTLDLTFDATVNSTGPYQNTAQIIGSDNEDPDSTPDNDDGDQSEDDEDAATSTVLEADLSLTKSLSDVNANVGDKIVFAIQISNAGASTATNVAVEDRLPPGYSAISNISDGGIFSGNIITWTGLNVPLSGLTLTYEVTVNIPTLEDGEYVNVAEIIASDQFDPNSDPDNDDGDQSEDDEDSAGINTPTTDIVINKVVDRPNPGIGDTVVFTITASNFGNIAATSVEVIDQLPTGYQFVSFVSSSGLYDEGSGIWRVPSIAPGDTATLEISVIVADVNDYMNIADLGYLDQIDDNASNDSSNASIDPICLEIYNEFSPNGNGVNEVFYIDCINNYPNNKLEIYNRWGNLVYRKDGYDNSFDGISNGRSVLNANEKLPVGTYYYILDLGDNSKRRAGWLYIMR